MGIISAVLYVVLTLLFAVKISPSLIYSNRSFSGLLSRLSDSSGVTQRWDQSQCRQQPLWEVRWGRECQGVAAEVPTDHPVLPCSLAVLLVRGAWPPAAAPTSEKPPERPPRETPHAAPPQLHELHETHSVTQVSGRVPPRLGRGCLGGCWAATSQAPDLGIGLRVPVGDVMFSKMQLLFKSPRVRAVSSP